MIAKKDEKILRKMLDMATDPEEALTYDELCGFLFGLAITPDLVLPGEWLPMVFGEEMITVDSEKEGQKLLDTLMRVVNDLTARFHEGVLRVPFDIEKLDHEDALLPIQAWAFGFNEALLLRPECWIENELPETPSEEQEELLTALSVIDGIANPDDAGEIFETHYEDDEHSSRLLASLFVILPTAVDSIMAHAIEREDERQEKLLSRGTGPPQARSSTKIGRNEPCPCGSGKKYKKCCLLKEKVVPIR
jgi:uncharacterized protein